MAAHREIMTELRAINQRLTKIEETVSRMNGHIDFVENTYDRVQQPFNRLMAMVGGRNNPPEQITNHHHFHS